MRIRRKSIDGMHRWWADSIPEFWELRPSDPIQRYALVHGIAHLREVGARTDDRQVPDIIGDFDYLVCKLEVFGRAGARALISECADARLDFPRDWATLEAQQLLRRDNWIFAEEDDAWPASRRLLQVCADRPLWSAMRHAAMRWLQRVQPGWYWLRRMTTEVDVPDDPCEEVLCAPVGKALGCGFDGRFLVVVGAGGEVAGWNAQTGVWLPTVQLDTTEDEGGVATGAGRVIAWWGRRVVEIRDGGGAVRDLPWPARGSVLGLIATADEAVAWSDHGEVVRYDGNCEVVACERLHGGAIGGVLDAGEGWYISWRRDGEIAAWHRSDLTTVRRCIVHAGGVFHARIVGERRLVTIGYNGEQARLWSWPEWRLLQDFDPSPATDVLPFDDGLLLATTDKGLWRMGADGDATMDEKNKELAPTRFEPLSDGFALGWTGPNPLARDSDTSNNMVSFWLVDRARGRLLHHALWGRDLVCSVAQIDHDRVAVVCDDGRVRLLRLSRWVRDFEAPVGNKFSHAVVAACTGQDPRQRGSYRVRSVGVKEDGAPVPLRCRSVLEASLMHSNASARPGRCVEIVAEKRGEEVVARWCSEVPVRPDWLTASGAVFVDEGALELQLYHDNLPAALDAETPGASGLSTRDQVERMEACHAFDAGEIFPRQEMVVRDRERVAALRAAYEPIADRLARGRAQLGDGMIAVLVSMVRAGLYLQSACGYQGRCPPAELLAERLELPLGNVRKVLALLERHPVDCSIDVDLDEDTDEEEESDLELEPSDEGQSATRAASPTFPPVHEECAMGRVNQLGEATDPPANSWEPRSDPGLSEKLMCLLRTLSSKEEKILRMRFGLPLKREVAIDEVARQIEVDPARFQQIKAKALRRLRHPARAERLKAFLQDVEGWDVGDPPPNWSQRSEELIGRLCWYLEPPGLRGIVRILAAVRIDRGDVLDVSMEVLTSPESISGVVLEPGIRMVVSTLLADDSCHTWTLHPLEATTLDDARREVSGRFRVTDARWCTPSNRTRRSR